MKRCSVCHELKPLDQFHRRKDSKDGRANRCSACAYAQHRAWYDRRIKTPRALEMAGLREADQARVAALSVPELAYLAGIVDGEGHIGVRLASGPRSRTPGVKVHLRVSNTNDALILWLTSRLGGAVDTRTAAQNHGRKPIHIWSPTVNLTVVLLRAIQPYLVIKRRAAEIAVEMAGTALPHEQKRAGVSAELQARRTALIEELTALNKRGG